MLLLFATQPSTYRAEFCWCRDVQIRQILIRYVAITATINIHG
jgi:hypothetical protein